MNLITYLRILIKNVILIKPPSAKLLNAIIAIKMVMFLFIKKNQESKHGYSPSYFYKNNHELKI